MSRKPLRSFTSNKGRVAHPSKPGEDADSATRDSAKGPADPGPPRALWRLIHIAEMSGLLASSDAHVMLTAFQKAGGKEPGVAVELDRFTLSLTDLYVLVTLFSAAPRPVPLAALSRETLADPLSLRRSLDHLAEMEAIVTENSTGEEPSLELTPSGQSLAVLVMYRVSNASIRPA